MSERKAREFWIGCHGFDRHWTAFESQEAYDDFRNNTPAIRARQVLPDEASTCPSCGVEWVNGDPQSCSDLVRKELEKLRDENERLKGGTLLGSMHDIVRNDNDRLRAENARLIDQVETLKIALGGNFDKYVEEIRRLKEENLNFHDACHAELRRQRGGE
jgi:hypothetical protein